MSDWVHIEPPVPRLTPVQERIREMLRAGKTFRQICVALMIRTDHLRDEIFEIRKWETIMGQGKKLTPEQLTRIEELKRSGMKQKDIAAEMGISTWSVSNVLNAMKARALYTTTDAQAEPEKKTGINKEFDDAVNEMIAEAAEPVAEPEPVQIVPAVPDAVIRAVEDKITELQNMIRDNEERMASMVQHNKKFAERIEILGEWLKEVQA